MIRCRYSNLMTYFWIMMKSHWNKENKIASKLDSTASELTHKILEKWSKQWTQIQKRPFHVRIWTARQMENAKDQENQPSLYTECRCSWKIRLVSLIRTSIEFYCTHMMLHMDLISSKTQSSHAIFMPVKIQISLRLLSNS